MVDLVRIAEAGFAEMAEAGENEIAHFRRIIHAMEKTSVQGAARHLVSGLRHASAASDAHPPPSGSERRHASASGR